MAGKAVYAGSFDPPTNGHIWMARRGAEIFDELVVAVGVDPRKKYVFPTEERADMMRRALLGVRAEVGSFENSYLVDYAKSIGAGHILRGIRNPDDYAYEHTMRNVNSDLGPRITTVFLMPPREMTEISSSLVRGLVGPDGWEGTVARYVPTPVWNRMLQRFGGYAQRWNALLGNTGASGDANALHSRLLGMYGEPHRYYHTISHVARCLAELDDARQLLELPDSAEGALWLHDAVYDPRARDNENRSAALADDFFRGTDRSFIDSVASLVLATRHQTATEGDGSYVADIDLSVFGRPEQEFDEYEAGIREEYRHVEEERFRELRAGLLEAFLNRGVYRTEFFNKKYGKQAGENLRRSIAALRE